MGKQWSLAKGQRSLFLPLFLIEPIPLFICINFSRLAIYISSNLLTVFDQSFTFVSLTGFSHMVWSAPSSSRLEGICVIKMFRLISVYYRAKEYIRVRRKTCSVWRVFVLWTCWKPELQRSCRGVRKHIFNFSWAILVRRRSFKIIVKSSEYIL